MGHISWKYIFKSNDVLKWNLKDKTHIVDVASVEYPSNVNSGDNITEEREFYTF